jgi:glycosyltransferase involved in cell wall biosynthesis
VLAGGAWGGGSVVVLAITKVLINRGNQVWVLCLDDTTERRFSEIGATIIRSPLWFHPINPIDVVPFLQVYKLCVQERFDLVATHTSKGGFIGRLAARLAGVPHIVHHAHGFAFRECNSPWVRRLYILLERFASRYCDSIISVSEDHRQGAIREHVASPDKIQTVLNGINIDAFAGADGAAARATLGFGNDDILLCVASRLAPKKGLEYLVEALPAVIAQHPSVQLVLFGDGPMRKELSDQASRLGVLDHIHFPGFRQDVPRLLSGFDLILQPSLSEGLSISILEAMASGRPLIACDIQGNREIIRNLENGLIVPPADSAALSGAILHLLSDPALAERMGRNAAVDCQSRFSESRMVEQTVRIYGEVVRSASAPAVQPQRIEPTASI